MSDDSVYKDSYESIVIGDDLTQSLLSLALQVRHMSVLQTCTCNRGGLNQHFSLNHLGNHLNSEEFICNELPDELPREFQQYKPGEMSDFDGLSGFYLTKLPKNPIKNFSIIAESLFENVSPEEKEQILEPKGPNRWHFTTYPLLCTYASRYYRFANANFFRHVIKFSLHSPFYCLRICTGSPELVSIPSDRTELFRMKSLTLRDKRELGRIVQSIANQDSPMLQDETPFTQLVSDGKVSAKMADALQSFSNSVCSQRPVSTGEVLTGVRKAGVLRGKNEFVHIYPRYSSNDIVQAISQRFCSFHGALNWMTPPVFVETKENGFDVHFNANKRIHTNSLFVSPSYCADSQYEYQFSVGIIISRENIFADSSTHPVILGSSSDLDLFLVESDRNRSVPGGFFKYTFVGARSTVETYLEFISGLMPSYACVYDYVTFTCGSTVPESVIVPDDHELNIDAGFEKALSAIRVFENDENANLFTDQLVSRVYEVDEPSEKFKIPDALKE
ncbi:hypothetical protein PCE1_000095 [Barthelona sp. PCE]